MSEAVACVARSSVEGSGGGGGKVVGGVVLDVGMGDDEEGAKAGFTSLAGAALKALTAELIGRIGHLEAGMVVPGNVTPPLAGVASNFIGAIRTKVTIHEATNTKRPRP